MLPVCGVIDFVRVGDAVVYSFTFFISFKQLINQYKHTMIPVNVVINQHVKHK